MEMVECSLPAAAARAPRPLPRRVRRPTTAAVLAGRARLRVRSERREQPPPPPTVRASGLEHGGRALGQAAAGLAAAAVVSLTGFIGDVSPLSPAVAQAESLTVAFPVSKAREVNRVQRTLVEAWGLIRETFVDPTFNHQDWDQKLQQTMVEMFPLKSADAAYSKISGMLSTLGDPFTKIISPKVCMYWNGRRHLLCDLTYDKSMIVRMQEYQSFRIGSDGNVQGVGVFINREPSSGRLLVMDCIQGGPADRAGIHEGDELVEIDGKSVLGLDGEAAAQRLRGRVGTTVKVKLLDGTENRRSGRIRQKEVQISREVINLSPLSTSIISHRSDDGHECKTGYVRLAAFSQTAAAEMENAIKRMEDEGVQSYILDLRNNPGGLVKAGLDVAQIWLDGDETLVNTVDRDGNVLPINLIQGHSLTRDPLVVLVNEGSASASEILAGALHDNGRAILVGHKTFGKGRIQSVTELDDGSALFITVAKYLSPALHEIDQVGIQPDIQCSPDILSLPRAPSLRENSEATSLEMDSCIMIAEQALEIEQTKGSAS
ncbi:carboxyl-terminal-processing peptidase 3, chloroplastic isoform X1 [Phragmites australis]|uniref:carboxyl-terminal-processing peptidase 3, chloroplastic isoform X1 n=1 Tax=Phragmites australis TaxID=29695 RepID=UPI002D771F2C|nr:carboxyl-terminal-processing peptidase 3, chloroplastic isoform X1 [Phragmites australis]